ncbi:MAG: amino acid permease [Candidatus Aenigmarchaeota archaeon]|nr:amino acid permease [Candidatus Aenigmarchaeota archaeon]
MKKGSNLEKNIGNKSLMFLAINAILGTGIFFLPAAGASIAGHSSLISWAMMSVVAVGISLYFAELVGMFPKSGGVYEYVKQAFGGFAGFVFGWTAWIIANLTIAMLIAGSILYILPGAGMLVSISLALFFILAFNLISYSGISVSTKLLLVFGILTIAAIAMLIIPGAASVSLSNFVFLAPISSIFLAVYMISETFFGWETVTYLSEEVRNPRILPKTIIIATVCIVVLSLLLVFVSLAISDVSQFASSQAPLVFLSSVIFGSEFSKIFALIIFIPLIGTAASWIISSPRLLYAMSRDHSISNKFSQIHKKHKTPHYAIMFQTAVTIFLTLAAFGNYYTLLSMLIPMIFLMYGAVMLSVVKLRISKPRQQRIFNAPFPRIGPLVIVVFFAILLSIWFSTPNALATIVMVFMLMTIGVPLYVMIKLSTDEKFTEKFFDKTSWFFDRLLSIWYKSGDAQNVISKLDLNQNSIVLDYGCGGGTTTSKLAEKAKNVIAVDISEQQMKLAMQKLKHKSNVTFFKYSQVPELENYFDAATAVGVLEYMKDPKKEVGKIITSLKKGGTFSFLSFGRSIGFPAPQFAKNEETIRMLFKDLPVKITVKKENKKLAEYWYIWGKKIK